MTNLSRAVAFAGVLVNCVLFTSASSYFWSSSPSSFSSSGHFRPPPRRQFTPNYCAGSAQITTNDYDGPVFMCMSSINCVLANGLNYGQCSTNRFSGMCCRLASAPHVSRHTTTVGVSNIPSVQYSSTPVTSPQSVTTSPATRPFTTFTTTQVPVTSTVEVPTKYPREMVELLCGRLSRGFNRRGRVVGGHRSLSRRQWPWLASVFQFDGKNQKQKCGAALLNENYIITAAHCLKSVQPHDLLIKLGSDDIREESEMGVRRNASSFTIHPDFNLHTFVNDVALIKLADPVPFASNIIPICLPRHMTNKSMVNSTATLIGWGREAEDGPMPRHLRYVNLTIISNERCSSEYAKVGLEQKLTSEFLCTYDGDGRQKDACEGDSGGPLVARDGDQFHLIGTVSWGIGSSCARTHQPTVFARITHYVDWIDKNMLS